MTTGDPSRLFQEGLPAREWTEFSAAGFRAPVSGCLFRSSDPPCCGVPLGGLGTGSIDIEATGALGYVTVFPTRRRHPESRYQTTYREPAPQLPFIGVSVEGETWVLTTDRHVRGGRITGCVEPGMNRELVDEEHWVDAWTADVPPAEGVNSVDEIEYWGHYPVADLEYVSSCPLGIGVRAWTPFVPGDAAASNTPAAIFEVRLRNEGDVAKSGTVAFSFPGPSQDGVGHERRYRIARVDGDVAGVEITSADGEIAYFLGALDVESVRAGAALHTTPLGWAEIEASLPESSNASLGFDTDDPGASLAVDFELAAGEARTVRLVLAWYAPTWTGGSHTEIIGFEQWDIGPHTPPGRESEAGQEYTAMYASRFPDVGAVVSHVAREHQELLVRILSWQQALYSAPELPGWLKDGLVNGLSVLTEDSYWAQPSDALGPWSYPNGAFGLIESPRGCAIMGCIVSNWYGDFPLLYFFPELERAVIDNYRSLMRPDGAVPFLYPNGDWTKPTYEWLLPLNGTCFVALADRLWRRTGDDAFLREVYPAVKANIIFTMNLLPPPAGVVSVHRVGTGQEWWEHTPVQGMVTHVAGLRLASLQIAARMAKAAGDAEFAEQCSEWITAAQELLEDNLWMEDAGSYMFFSDVERDASSDDILTSQLDGDWMSFSHGFDGVFRNDRALRALETIERTCVGPYAVAGFARRDGAAERATGVTFSRKGVAEETPYGTFTAETDIIGMTFLYHGLAAVGLEIVRRNADNFIRIQGHGWDLPNMVRSDNGARNFGTDYFQKLTIWAVPAALEGGPIEAPCRTGGLVDRVLQAAGPATHVA